MQNDIELVERLWPETPLADVQQKIDGQPIVNGIRRFFRQIQECTISTVYELIQLLQYWTLLAVKGSAHDSSGVSKRAKFTKVARIMKGVRSH